MRDRDYLAAVSEILTANYGQSPWTKEQIAQDMAQATTDYYYVYDHEKVVGFMSVNQLVGESELTNLAILPAYQKKGYAKQLLSQLEDSLVPVFLEVRQSNQRAITLYQANGFRIIGRRKAYYHAPVEDALIMKKEGL
ncbi:Ribosomal-protein-S18p-alanine acetyltransferase [Streptococcus sp. DD12]|nr:ribosomal protein S18-alanine N-acetyltransferase [Streptococcus sp. DD12]KXT75560.1 Ribosomal-protein-S18p-alanine acetyltransferase [Streptococcus sp. DD12]